MMTTTTRTGIKCNSITQVAARALSSKEHYQVLVDIERRVDSRSNATEHLGTSPHARGGVEHINVIQELLAIGAAKDK